MTDDEIVNRIRPLLIMINGKLAQLVDLMGLVIMILFLIFIATVIGAWP